jgi:uncharacterized protein YdbL (DUF1318 family)
MKFPTFLRTAVLLFAGLFATSLLLAQNLAALRERMENRLPAINALKDRHVVGETNRGFLEVRGGVPAESQQVVSEENSDRRQVYAALARQTGSTVDEVGRKRAEQVAGIAKRGHWIQSPAGEWRQK